MRLVRSCVVFALACIAFTAVASAQSIIEDFDSYTPGLPPGGAWWVWGDGGTTLIDDTVFHGSSGSSVAVDRGVFPGADFAFGTSFAPVEDRAQMMFSFRYNGCQREMLSAFATAENGSVVGPWVTVCYPSVDFIHVYSESGGWSQVLTIQPDTWYRVELNIDVAANTYDITVVNEDNPSDTNTLTDVPFRTAAGVPSLATVQFGDFSDAGDVDAFTVWVDDVSFIPPVFDDGFESGDTTWWTVTVP